MEPAPADDSAGKPEDREAAPPPTPARRPGDGPDAAAEGPARAGDSPEPAARDGAVWAAEPAGGPPAGGPVAGAKAGEAAEVAAGRVGVIDGPVGPVELPKPGEPPWPESPAQDAAAGAEGAAPVMDSPESVCADGAAAGGPAGGPDGPASPEPAGAGLAGAAAGSGQAAPSEGDDRRFKVVLKNFEGPFDLLLQLISRHKLDVTEVALSRVTDDFMAHIRAMGPDWDLDQTTEFLVVAATLLDLKAARLLPTAEVEDEADLALLEARDLLFARLLQYRAFKRVADIFQERLAAEALRHPRTVGLEPHHAELLPDVVISIGPEGFARLAVKAMQPKPRPQVYVDHIHAPLVSVREQAEVVIGRLRELGRASFGDLVADAPDTLTVVARFLALLELYRERAVTLDQEEALGTLLVSWSGGEPDRPLVTDEFDQESAPPAKEE
ncbi:segregation and condensation protein A [Streptomyces hainanensis]|uniref:Segregation and condensation protein A n=1 Tax=Streptomyces hainanensis TaxID=402648 RepID=A0A4R4SXR1_9ACTN|nr:segregation/condensation protein A [Streptomyces hainanensis]TDC68987.1 segregation/condensation protein A [Streptomyces hainanensis]